MVMWRSLDAVKGSRCLPPHNRFPVPPTPSEPRAIGLGGRHSLAVCFGLLEQDRRGGRVRGLARLGVVDPGGDDEPDDPRNICTTKHLCYGSGVDLLG